VVAVVQQKIGVEKIFGQRQYRRL